MNWLKCLKSFWWHVIANIYTQHTSKCAHTNARAFQSFKGRAESELWFNFHYGMRSNLPISCGARNSAANMHLEVNKKLFILFGACYQTTAARLHTDIPSWQGKTTSKSPRCVDSERENMCTPCLKKTKTKLYASSSIPDQISRHNLIFAEGRVKLTDLF